MSAIARYNTDDCKGNSGHVFFHISLLGQKAAYNDFYPAGLN
jgi:hypothetical protein